MMQLRFQNRQNCSTYTALWIAADTYNFTIPQTRFQVLRILKCHFLENVIILRT